MKTNKRLDYTLIAEGYAEYAFIPTYLRLIAEQYKIQAVRSKLGFKGQNAGKSKVLKEAEPISTTAILQSHQLIVIGIDLDAVDYEQEQPKHTAECDLVLKALGKTHKNYGNRIVHFVTVQAIEQWLAYQAYKIGLAEKFLENSQESKHQSELKKLLYGPKDNGPNMDRVAEKIATSADFNELAKQSRSFAHFHNQVTAFLALYNK
ncbi:hypothetical protein EXU85_02215 [Spirosoma sp. KCTC 42546]|uniref:hypothetical protein n=1 Tax=Spirosoma sp. KCTC 42546 TaxID=2520506 RepID=UPI00115B86CF|nr:hypothetical protein [Spirosoma sp. KCTC 42546]QDK77472.1 hypothetical protein EXU85_02215 [Spirosoma sp. KCTC 42546]